MRALRLLAMVFAAVVALLVLAFGYLQTPPGQRLLADLVSGKSLKVSGLGGFFPTDLQVARVELLDTQGPWLVVENARLTWSFASLFEGRVRVELLSASRIDVQRPPAPDKTEEKTGGGTLSELPIGVDVQAVSIDTLHLAQPVANIDSSWRLQGSGLLSADLHEGRLRLNGDRLDGPVGKLAADLRLDLARRTVDGTVTFDEEQGGVVAALLERPDLDRVSARLTAKGDAAQGSGELTVSAGDAVTATGSARWQPAGDGTAVSVRLDAAGTRVIERGGPVQLTAEATLDATTASLTAATLTAGPLTLTANGRYGRESAHLDGTATLRFSEPGTFGQYLEGVRWRDLEVTAHAVLDDLAKQPQGTVTLNGSVAELVVAQLEGQLPPLGRVAFNSELGLKSDGSFTLQSLQVTSALASVAARDGTFVPKTETAEVKAAIDLPSLAPFSTLAGRELAGRGHVDLSLRQDAQGVTVGWQGALTDAGAPGVPPGLVAHEVTLSGNATHGADQRWSLSDVRVASEAGSFGLSARGQGSAGRFDFAVELRRLALLREGLEGNATVTSTIELRPDGTAGGNLNATGNAQGQPVSLAGRFERDAAGGLAVPSFEGHWASATLHVSDLAVTHDRTTGSARLQVERLAEIGALLGSDMAGSVEAEVSTDPQLAQGRLQTHVRVKDARGSGVGVASLQLDATIDDPMGTATTDAKIAASGLRGAGDFTRLNATIKGDQQSGLDVTLQAAGGQSDANLAARVELGEEIRIALARFDGRQQGIPISLAAPTRFAVAGAHVRIDPTNLRVGGGRLAVQGVVDPAASNLTLDLAGLPLSIIDTLSPGTGIDGTLQARARVSGPSANPHIEATYGAANVRLRRPEAALLPALALQGSGTLAGGQATIDARLAAGGGTNLALKGKVATASTTGSATITGAVDIAPFAPLLGNQVRNVAGVLRTNLAVDIAAGGRVSGRGTIDIAGVALSMPEAGMRLSGGTGRVQLQGDVVQLQQLAFQTSSNGSLTTNGTLRLDPAQGVVLDLGVVARRALLVSRPDLVATVSSDLKITGSTTAGVDVSGPITIDRAEIEIGAGQTASFPTVEVREINGPRAANAPPPPPPRAAAAPRAAPPPSSGAPVRLALTVRAPQAVFVRGRGLNAEMGGEVKVNGDPAAPQVSGGLTLRRGDFNLAGRRLVFSRGVVSLDNLDRIDPRLDFVASTSVQSTTIMVTISGTSRAPLIALSSTPPLPQDEAMAMLLFGKPASGLSAFELIQAAQALAELTGRDPGGNALGRLRQGLGLDQLRLGSSDSRSSSSPVSIEAGRYVAPGVYVGAKQGAAGNSSRGVVEIQVLENTKIEGDIGADSRGRVGVKMEWDY